MSHASPYGATSSTESLPRRFSPSLEAVPEAPITATSSFVQIIVEAGLYRAEDPLHVRLVMARPATEGYITVDGSSAPTKSAECHTDLAQFDAGEAVCDQLWLDQVLEGMPFTQALAQLLRCKLWLKPEGMLRITTLDVEACARQLASEGSFSDKASALSQMYGDAASPRFDGWYRAKIRRVLDALGFKIESLQSRSTGTTGRTIIEVNATKADENLALDGAKVLLAETLTRPGGSRLEQLFIELCDVLGLAQADDVPGTGEAQERHTEQVRQLAKSTQTALVESRFEAARELLLKLLALVPESADTMVTLANVYLMLNQTGPCEQMCIKAGSITPAGGALANDLATTLVGLARRYEEAGNTPMARLSLERALRAAPDHPDVRDHLARIEDTMAASQADATQHSTTRDLQPELPTTTAEAPCPVVSIIVRTHNQLVDTKLCLESIEQHTTESHEIIVVDDASTDGTIDYLRDWASQRPQVSIISNRNAAGSAGSNNLGMALARGKYIVLLSNDAIVTEGWLTRMTAVFERHHDVGLVGPRSNGLIGAQLDNDADYRSLDDMHAHAREVGAKHDGLDRPAQQLIASCLMVRRAVIEQIGGFDARFDRGNFEDDDFCLRASVAGYGARIAEDVFIHHSESTERRDATEDDRAGLETNWNILRAKWGFSADHTFEQGVPASIAPPEGVMDVINLPDLGTNFENGDDRWWVESKTPASAKTATKMAAAAAPEAAPTTTTTPEGARMLQLFDVAEAAANDGNWAEAAELFLQLVEAKPTFGPAYVGLASASFATGDITTGMLAIEQACDFYPDNVTLHAQRGVALAHSGRLEDAERAFLRALDLDENNIDAIISLAQLCRAKHCYVEAVELLDVAHQKAPADPTVIAAIGTTSLELGDFYGAHEALRKLTEIAPEHAETALLTELLNGSD